MNSIITHYYPILETYQELRELLMETLEDEDLDYRPTARNPTLGELCRENGEVEQAYASKRSHWISLTAMSTGVGHKRSAASCVVRCT